MKYPEGTEANVKRTNFRKHDSSAIESWKCDFTHCAFQNMKSHSRTQCQDEFRNLSRGVHKILTTAQTESEFFELSTKLCDKHSDHTGSVSYFQVI